MIITRSDWLFCHAIISVIMLFSIKKHDLLTKFSLSNELPAESCNLLGQSTKKYTTRQKKSFR